MISEELLQSFIAEASDLLDDVEPALVEYPRLADAEERMEVVNRVFRHVHSIKGSAGFVGLHDIAKLTHEAETLLEQFRKNPDTVIPQDSIDLLCRTVDLLRAIFESGGERGDDGEDELGIDSLIKEISAATDKIKGRNRQGFSALSLSADAKMALSTEVTLDTDGPDATQVVPPADAEKLAEAGRDSSATTTTPTVDVTSVTRSRPRAADSTQIDPRRPVSQTRRIGSDTARIIRPDELAKRRLNSSEFAARFVSEANELLEQIEHSLLQAEQHPEAGGDSIHEALRCLHSFKGNSGFMNLKDLERLSHRMESEVENNIGASIGLDSQTFDALLQMIDVLRQGVVDFSCGGTGAIQEVDAYIAMMDEFRTATRAAARVQDTSIQLAETHPSGRNAPVRIAGDTATAAAKADSSPTELKPRPAVPPADETVIAPVAKVAERAAELSPVDTVQADPPDDPEPQTEADGSVPKKRGTDTTRLVLRGAASAQENLRDVPKAESISIGSARPGAGSPAPAPAPAPAAAASVAAAAAAAGRQPKNTERLTKTTDTAAVKPAKTSDTRQKRRSAEISSRNDIRVDLRKLDSMLDLVGELVIAEAMVTSHPVVWNADNESLERAVHQLRRVAGSLQDMATSVRMIPLAPTFRRMTRLVYDLSVKAGKQVDLILLGEDTEVDRTVIERISDPLVHIIRNAIDHGIEPPNERVNLGKPETGRLTIEGHHEGGEVWIVITDDGRGLDRRAILNRAISRGLVQGDGSDLTENQIHNFIFEPGFSTATKVTDISGRGFGMDVVKKNIEKLSGRIDIRTRPGEGTAVAMRIPLTLAIIDGMLVSSGSTRYIIPLLSIRESLKPEESQIIRTPDGQQMVKLRSDLIPIVRLDETFARVRSDRNMMDGILMIVEGEDGEVVALSADELLGQQETVIKGLSGWLKKSRGVSGCTILGDGEVGLILDIGAIVRLARQRSA